MRDFLFDLIGCAFGAIILGAFLLGMATLLSGCAPARLIADCVNRTIGCS